MKFKKLYSDLSTTRLRIFERALEPGTYELTIAATLSLSAPSEITVGAANLFVKCPVASRPLGENGDEESLFLGFPAFEDQIKVADGLSEFFVVSHATGPFYVDALFEDLPSPAPDSAELLVFLGIAKVA
jgi:hypothetical protein